MALSQVLSLLETLVQLAGDYVTNDQKLKIASAYAQTAAVRNASACLKHLYHSYSEYQKVLETEKTKRQDIAAWEKATLEKIKEQRDILITYLEKSFSERSQNFKMLFSVVDSAILSDNNDQLALALHAIVELAKSNPFGGMGSIDAVKASLQDPLHKWEL